MKKILSIALLILTLAFMLTSCDIIIGIFVKHTVSFDLNGGEAGEDFAESVEVSDGETLTLPIPTREGYTFIGWYSGKTEVTEDTPIKEDLDLCAKWEIKSFKVSFLDYYGKTISTQTVEFGESASAPNVESIINKKRFDGWSADFSCVVEDMTVRALYVDNTYTITYDLGDKGESFTEPCFYGEVTRIPAAPEIEGFVFSGWFLDEELTERYFFDYKLDRDITLYARFYDISLGEYIVISNFTQLMAINDQPSAKYLLACDINCKGEDLTPIKEFHGEIDGNGYKVHNFIMSQNSFSLGFILANMGTVKNLYFSDFIMSDTGMTNVGADYFFGVIVAVNYGTISNCHILDSELNITIRPSTGTMAVLIGGIVGINGYGGKAGKVEDCTSSVTIKADVTHSSRFIYTSIGGIAGRNGSTGEVIRCASFSEINSVLNAGAGGEKHYYVGGVVGENLGNIRESYNTADVITRFENNGETTFDICVGGAVGLNWGKVYNSYSSGNLLFEGAAPAWMGGFVGYNQLVNGYTATITKCFSTGNVQFDSITDEESVGYGYFAGNSTATIKDCYHLDEAEIIYKAVIDDSELTEIKEPTCTVSEEKTFAQLTSVDFIENTLYFDRMVWFVVEGQLPTLR